MNSYKLYKLAKIQNSCRLNLDAGDSPKSYELDDLSKLIRPEKSQEMRKRSRSAPEVMKSTPVNKSDSLSNS